MEKTVGGTISYTKKVGNVNVDQHWNIREEMSTGYVLATCLKLYVFDHIKGIDSRTKNSAMNPFKLYGTTE
jgi:hypothetical protein